MSAANEEELDPSGLNFTRREMELTNEEGRGEEDRLKRSKGGCTTARARNGTRCEAHPGRISCKGEIA